MVMEQQIGFLNVCGECKKTINSGEENIVIPRKAQGTTGTTVEVATLEELTWDESAKRKFVGYIHKNRESLVLFEDSVVCQVCGSLYTPRPNEYKKQIQELQELQESEATDDLTVFIVKPVTAKRSGFMYEFKQFLSACLPSTLCCPCACICGPGIIAGQAAYRRDPNKKGKAICTGIVTEVLAIVVVCGILFVIVA